MRTRFLSALILAHMAILAPAIVVPTTAQAHAEYDRSDPAAGATVSAAPTAVTVWFTEELASQGSSLEVRDAANARVDTGNSHVIDDAPKNSMTIGLRPNLPNGVYTVSWMTVSAEDGDSDSGTFSFGVGVPAPAPAAGTVTERKQDVPAGPPYDVSGTVVSLRGDNLELKTGQTDVTGMDIIIRIDASDISKRNISVGNSITLTVGPRVGDIPKAWVVVSQGSYTEGTDFSPANDQTRNESSHVKNQADDDEARNKQKHEKGAED
jgi:methionine-rich copper-binding protein CopC